MQDFAKILTGQARKDPHSHKVYEGGFFMSGIFIVDGREYEIVSVFEGAKTASELIYDLAVKKILYDNIEEIDETT